MTAQQKIAWILGGTFAFLILASFVARMLRHVASSEKTKTTVDNLISRIVAWWWMVIVFSIVVLLGKVAALILFAIISFLAFREFMTLTPTRSGDYRALFYGFFIIIPIQYYLIHIEWYALFTIFIPVYGFLILPAFSAIAGDTEQFLERIAKIQWAVMLAIYCISHAPALLLLQIERYDGQNVLLLLYLLLIVQLSDVFQYVFGKLFGKHKIAPHVSPSKTIEGFIGGAVTAILIGVALFWITPYSPLQSAGMAGAIVIMGFLGGLTLSAIKRGMGVKDWGNMIEGHGGVLDRMDSVCFSAPIFFHLTRYFFAS